MESEQVEKSMSTEKALFVGFSCGIFASVIAYILAAIIWGPKSESIEVDVYSGHIIVHRHSLWQNSRVHMEKPPHVKWAIQHQDPVRSWYLAGSGSSRGWFGSTLHVEAATRAYVYEIYSLQISEVEKVNLLHQYHKELDELKLVYEGQRKIFDSIDAFYMNWEQKLKQIRKQATN